MRSATLKILLAMCILAAFCATAPAQTHTWYINDGPNGTYWWEDTGIGPFWEWMTATAIEEGDTLCGIADVPDGVWATAYYAATLIHTADYSDCRFWAVLYLENSYTGQGEPVYATLGVANPMTMTFTPVVGPVAQTVTNTGPLDCGQPYTFDFGFVSPLVLTNASLALEITHINLYDSLPHIFWDSECCPSALYAECPSPVEEESWSVIKALYK